MEDVGTVLIKESGQKMAHFYTPITSSNIKRFSRLFHCRNQKNRVCSYNASLFVTVFTIDEPIVVK